VSTGRQDSRNSGTKVKDHATATGPLHQHRHRRPARVGRFCQPCPRPAVLRPPNGSFGESWGESFQPALPRNHRPQSTLPLIGTPHMTFEILPNAGEIDTQNGRCEAMVINSGLPAYRCTRIAATDRKSRRVCEAHTRSLRIRFYDADG
jgi:hypothetical protein